MARVRNEVTQEDLASAEYELYEQSDAVGLRHEPEQTNFQDDLGEQYAAESYVFSVQQEDYKLVI